MAHRKTAVSVYAATHFLVDFACAFLFFGSIRDTGTLFLCFLLYNFFAFALQMPLGLLADKLNKNALVAVAGCALVAAAYGLTAVPVAAVVAAGVGNGLFHIGGGIDVLNASEGKAGVLGVFVAPGALGIFLGKLLGKLSGLPLALVLISLLAAAALILKLRFTKGKAFSSGNVPVSFDKAGSAAVLAAALCLFFVVCLRSYVGMALSFDWKGEGYWGWALIFAVVLGKTAGGFLADRFGAVRTSLVSLALAAALFCLPSVPLAGVAAVFLFNMTMPITLWAAARLFPGAKGFSFGLLTFGLFLGFLPAYLGYPPLLGAGAGFALASAISLVLLWLGLRRTA